MANILLGGGIADARGSVGGVVFSRGKGGAILRNRTKPINPRSAAQTPIRSRLAYLATYWSKTLTQQYRDNWTAYAVATSWTNKLGQAITMNGNSAFIRLNTLLIMAGEPLRADAPTLAGHAGGQTVTWAADTTTQHAKITAVGGAMPILVAENFLLLFAAAPVTAGALGVPSAWRYMSKIEGATPTPLPVSVDYPWTMSAGARIWLKSIFIDINFRIGPDVVQSEIAAPLV